MTNRLSTNPPKVSVVSITYNHEAYIHAALDGFVAQKTNFPVEVIVADDASTDATPAVIQEYTRRYPHIFRPILRSENVGVHRNLTEALSATRGEYLAVCEGDDYWTDPEKLSKQVTFLDRHPETAVCFHPVQVVWEDGRAPDYKFPSARLRGDMSLETLLSRNFIQTNSVMYRRMPRYDDIPVDVMPMDYYLHVRHAAHGAIAMLPDTMAVYRRHPQGIWSLATVDPAKFWLKHGPGHLAAFDAMLDLFPGDPELEQIIAGRAAGILNKLTKEVPIREGRVMLEDAVARHPRIAILALQHKWEQKRQKGLKSLWRKLVLAAS